MTTPSDDRQFCPVCAERRPVLWGAYGALRCRVCGAAFTLSESLRAAECHALDTVRQVAAQVPK